MIGLVAPSLPGKVIDGRQFRRGVDRLRQLGYETIVGEACLDRPYDLGASIAARARDINRFFEDDQIDAIMGVIGGYNANEVLPHIDYGLVVKNPKPFFGYSDLSAINLSLLSQADQMSYSGSMLVSFCPKQLASITIDGFLQAIKGVNLTDEWKAPASYAYDDWFREDVPVREWHASEGIYVINEGVTEGTIIPTNLDTLLSLVGTNYLPSLQGVVLLLEENIQATNNLFRRNFAQLAQTGIMDGLNALVMGRFPGPQRENKDALTEVLHHYLPAKEYPVITNVNYGHTDPSSTFLVGGTATINTYDRKFTIARPEVERQ
ncbi:LD-carboxypeptidase [Candidatus Woesearchaeota archaeon]|nr:LD-carboxypeptidase [Candidatus Woesearchaeota archaeon]